MGEVAKADEVVRPGEVVGMEEREELGVAVKVVANMARATVAVGKVAEESVEEG